MAFYSLDPWGDQRADLRMARIVSASLFPHVKSQPDPNDFMLFPDDAHDIPEDADDQERKWMLKLNRSAKED